MEHLVELRSRLIKSAIAVAIGLCALGGVLPGLVVVAAVALTYSVMTAITWHRYRASR